MIEYIENNLDGDVSVDVAAEIACSSKYHFHRMFHATLGITFAEHVRRRRLSKAGAELLSSTEKIIDIAAKYGFESPNAFTRAFRNLHGINPSEARSGNIKLSAYRPASSQTKAEGEDMLQYRIVEKPEFQIIGKAKEFDYETFIKTGPKFWKEYVGSEEYARLSELSLGRSGVISEAPLMSVFFPNEDGCRDSFNDVLCIEKTPDMESNIFSHFSIPSASYAEFSCRYPASVKTNKRIYGEWFEATGYERDSSKPDIAAYFPIAFRPLKDMEIRWWIPVVKKS
ncbi:helix-turn-helix domain-containing protein [Pseudoteredinibacter isoporae]|uniref:helix-turn-helix domain-containing protein n=1 Tax=Pseudoteredinibacter isoporae TaxID=570281 RepID=UPI00160A015D